MSSRRGSLTRTAPNRLSSFSIMCWSALGNDVSSVNTQQGKSTSRVHRPRARTCHHYNAADGVCVPLANGSGHCSPENNSHNECWCNQSAGATIVRRKVRRPSALRRSGCTAPQATPAEQSRAWHAFERSRKIHGQRERLCRERARRTGDGGEGAEAISSDFLQRILPKTPLKAQKNFFVPCVMYGTSDHRTARNPLLSCTESFTHLKLHVSRRFRRG